MFDGEMVKKKLHLKKNWTQKISGSRQSWT